MRSKVVEGPLAIAQAQVHDCLVASFNPGSRKLPLRQRDACHLPMACGHREDFEPPRCAAMGRGTALRSKVVEGQLAIALAQADQRIRDVSRCRQHIARGNVHHPVTLRFQPSCPLRIAYRGVAHVMCDAVDFEARLR